MLEKILTSFSLSPKEKKIFRLLHKSELQPASRLAHVSEIPRNTVRGILEKLVRLGLVARTRRANTHYYSCEKKDALIRVLKLRKENLAAEIDAQIQDIEEFGDVLDQPSHQTGKRPQITFYDGLDGLKKVYEDSLTSSEEIRSWASFDSNQDALPRYFRTYYKRRANKKIRIRAIHPSTELARKETQTNKIFFRESVLVPIDQFEIGPEVQIYDDKVSIASWDDKIGVLIKSKEIATALKSIFELSYSLAKQRYKVR